MKKFTSPTQKVGEVGENVACAYLEKSGYEIVERNFTRKWGEIDVVAQRSGVLRFIEVKAVSCESFDRIEAGESYKPEYNMSDRKLKRLTRTIETYLSTRSERNRTSKNENWDETGEWAFDVASVYLDFTRNIGRVKLMSDVILS